MLDLCRCERSVRSEVTAEEIDRASAVHPIAAVQSEWSVWSRDVERHVVPTARQHGIGFVPYSPPGRGFLTGSITSRDAVADDWRGGLAQFTDDAFATNLAVTTVIQAAAQLEVTPAQVALAWLYAKGRALDIPVVPIPGTRRAARVTENRVIDQGRARLSTVSVDDLGAALASLACLENARVKPGMVLHATHPVPTAIVDILNTLTDCLQVELPRRPLPLADALQRGAEIGISEHQVHLMSTDHWYASERIWRLINWSSTPFSRAVRRHLGWYRHSAQPCQG